MVGAAPPTKIQFRVSLSSMSSSVGGGGGRSSLSESKRSSSHSMAAIKANDQGNSTPPGKIATSNAIDIPGRKSTYSIGIWTAGQVSFVLYCQLNKDNL